MTVVSKGSTSGLKYLHPEGQFAVRCIDQVDLGVQQTNFGPKLKCKIRFFGGQYTEDREPIFLDAFFTQSLHEKSKLRPFLESWRGRPFTPQEEQGFDLEKLVGACALVQVVHNSNADGTRTYANISSIMRGTDGPTPPESFVRQKDEPDDYDEPSYQPNPPAGADTPPVAASLSQPDDDLPF